jgi:DNA replication protein DnaC
MTEIDDEVLTALAQCSAARRAVLGLDADGRARPPPALARCQGGGATATFGEALAAHPAPDGDVAAPPLRLPPIALIDGELVVHGPFACRGGCGEDLPFPGVCPRCAEEQARQARRELASARMLEHLPADFQDATWEDLPNLHDRTGSRPRVALDPNTLPTVRFIMEEAVRTVIRGPTGCGKSTLAACWLREAFDKGLDGLFVPATALEDTAEGRTLFAEAAAVERLVLDDLAGELFAAPPRGGVAAIRIRMVAKLLRVRFASGRRTVITTEKSREELEAIYTTAIARRIFDGAADLHFEDDTR